MYSMCCSLLRLSTVLLLTSCSALAREDHNIEAVELLYFDAFAQTWAYKMDSVGHVQALHLNYHSHDSTVYCFTLSKPQRDQLLTLTEQIVGLDSLEANVLKLEISDSPIRKVVVYRQGKAAFSYNEGDVPGYADPTLLLAQLAHQLRKTDEVQLRKPCVAAFSAPELAQGYEDLFRLPRINTLSSGSAQD